MKADAGTPGTARTPSLQVMYRERAAGMYDELPFAAAQCLVELPYNLLQALLFAVVAYFMMGFENDVGACLDRLRQSLHAHFL